jgi:hypothetical protein
MRGWGGAPAEPQKRGSGAQAQNHKAALSGLRARGSALVSAAGRAEHAVGLRGGAKDWTMLPKELDDAKRGSLATG